MKWKERGIHKESNLRQHLSISTRRFKEWTRFVKTETKHEDFLCTELNHTYRRNYGVARTETFWRVGVQRSGSIASKLYHRDEEMSEVEKENQSKELDKQKCKKCVRRRFYSMDEKERLLSNINQKRTYASILVVSSRRSSSILSLH